MLFLEYQNLKGDNVSKRSLKQNLVYFFRRSLITFIQMDQSPHHYLIWICKIQIAVFNLKSDEEILAISKDLTTDQDLFCNEIEKDDLEAKIMFICEPTAILMYTYKRVHAANFVLEIMSFSFSFHFKGNISTHSLHIQAAHRLLTAYLLRNISITLAMT